MCTINEDHMIYDSWDIRHDGQFLLHFGSFEPPNNPKNQNFEEMKKAPADTILHLRIAYDDMIYGSWDIEGDRRNFLSFWTILCPLTPLITQKIKILKTCEKNEKTFSKIFKKWKKAWRYHYFTQVYQKSWSYATLEIWCVTDVIVTFHFGLFFALLRPPPSPPPLL